VGRYGRFLTVIGNNLTSSKSAALCTEHARQFLRSPEREREKCGVVGRVVGWGEGVCGYGGWYVADEGNESAKIPRGHG
jgi:hypothetical protein